MASDQEEFTVPEKVARMSTMITNMLDGESERGLRALFFVLSFLFGWWRAGGERATASPLSPLISLFLPSTPTSTPRHRRQRR